MNASASHLSAFVPTELREALEEYARAHDRSLSAELRCAIRSHVGERARLAAVVRFARGRGRVPRLASVGELRSDQARSARRIGSTMRVACVAGVVKVWSRLAEVVRSHVRPFRDRWLQGTRMNAGVIPAICAGIAVPCGPRCGPRRTFPVRRAARRADWWEHTGVVAFRSFPRSRCSTSDEFDTNAKSNSSRSRTTRTKETRTCRAT